MMILFLLVLHSGFLQFIFTTNRLRSFRETGKLGWNDSLKNCTDKGGSLITLYDEEDAGFVETYKRTDNKSLHTIWLGLRKDRINVTTWSNGEVPTNFTTPSILRGEQLCGAAEGQSWHNYKCSDPKTFMCQKGTNYTLINETKNWGEALRYCRRHFTDLAIINDQQEADYVLNRSKGDSFWIGLLHDEWRWVDQSCSTYRNWNDNTQPGNCSVITSLTGRSFKRHECDMEAVGLCSKGNVRIKVIKDPQLSWEDSLKYCETNHSRLLWIEGKEDQDAVEQWLKYYFKKDTISYPLWISMRQSSVFGFWIWSDRIVSWNNWENGRQPELSETFQCGVINEDFTWSNENCLKNLSFICEEDIVWMNE